MSQFLGQRELRELLLAELTLQRLARDQRGGSGARERLAQRFATMAERANQLVDERLMSPAERCVSHALEQSGGTQDSVFWSTLSDEVTAWLRDCDSPS